MLTTLYLPGLGTDLSFLFCWRSPALLHVQARVRVRSTHRASGRVSFTFMNTFLISTQTSTTNAPLFDTTQFTRKDKPSVLATRDGEIVILPASVLEWAVAQPETVLSKTAADRERLHPEYTFPRPEILDQHQSQGRAATDTLLTSDALLQPQILPMLFDELRSAVDELLDGSDVTTTTTTTRGGFNTVVLHQTISEIVARAWNRALVGLPTCEFPPFFLPHSLRYFGGSGCAASHCVFGGVSGIGENTRRVFLGRC